MDESNHDENRKLFEEYEFLFRRQRRFLIEIAIAVGFICLLAGFVAGASWHWKRSAELHPPTLDKPGVEAKPKSDRTGL